MLGLNSNHRSQSNWCRQSWRYDFDNWPVDHFVQVFKGKVFSSTPAPFNVSVPLANLPSECSLRIPTPPSKPTPSLAHTRFEELCQGFFLAWYYQPDHQNHTMPLLGREVGLNVMAPFHMLSTISEQGTKCNAAEAYVVVFFMKCIWFHKITFLEI